jgi:hypothetical protein
MNTAAGRRCCATTVEPKSFTRLGSRDRQTRLRRRRCVTELSGFSIRVLRAYMKGQAQSERQVTVEHRDRALVRPTGPAIEVGTQPPIMVGRRSSGRCGRDLGRPIIYYVYT